jgi:hypothetical protein
MECRTPFTGRSDKKFCSDYCRNGYNNKRNSTVNNFVRNINYVLRKNRRILAAKYIECDAETNLQELNWAGYNFEYFTNFYRTTDGMKYSCCYDFGISFLKNRRVRIISLDSINSPGSGS